METVKDGQNPRMTLTPVFLGSLAFVFLNFSLPIYTRSLGADALAIGGLYSVFTVTMLLFRPLVGWALDRYGRRWFFVFAFLFYTFSMVAFSRAEVLIDFYLARFLQGIGASLMWVSARTIIADLTEGGGRGREMGRLASRSVQGSMVGATWGFTLLGMFPIQEAWKWAFAGYAAAALLGFLVALARGTETRVAVVNPGLAPVRVQGPLRHLLIIVLLSNFASALIQPIYLIFLQDKFDLSIVGLALAFFPAGIVFAILPNYTGRWADRFGRAPMMALGISAAAVVSLGLPWLPGILWVALLYTLFSAGWATASPAEDALLGDLASKHERGRIFGIKEAAASLGAALGPLTGGAVYEYLSAELTFVLNGVLLLVTAALVIWWFKPALQRP
jgi:MFS family permease